MTMSCKICGHTVSLLFEKKILGKYKVGYYQCAHCGFMQTEQPYWLNEAYQSAITALDLGLANRNLVLAPIVETIIKAFFNSNALFLDYGGGYGLLVRMLRDKGFRFYREDKFCENLFAKNFDVTDLPAVPGFELITAFEVFEHLPEPLQEIEKMLTYGKSILFSTELQPAAGLADWWYISPETGQHVSFYSYPSLVEIARKFNLHLYSNRRNIHLLTPAKLSYPLFRVLARRKPALLFNAVFPNKRSLLMDDHSMVKQKLHSQEV